MCSNAKSEKFNATNSSAIDEHENNTYDLDTRYRLNGSEVFADDCYILHFRTKVLERNVIRILTCWLCFRPIWHNFDKRIFIFDS
jgi:hypothetical protein